MEQSITQAQPHTIWINRSKHILSFHEVQCDGYEPLVFSNHKEKMDFVFETCAHGFRIQ